VSDSNGSEVVVLKVGGSVLTGTKAFHRAALFLKHRLEQSSNEKPVVVVSAQKLATDRLERRARSIVREPSVRALDLLWSTGELRSVALLALHLQAIEISSVGLNVHETGLLFSTRHEPCPTRPSVAAGHLKDALAEHAIVVVPGFLATRWDGVVVSLGRGGSDLSAVLLAIGIRATRCELIKDVPGYFEEDPNRNSRARHLPSLSFEEALRMAERGCELVQPRALLVAAEANLPLVIRNMEERAPVTVISRNQKNEQSEVHDVPVVEEA
jgi:aspartate kinase